MLRDEIANQILLQSSLDLLKIEEKDQFVMDNICNIVQERWDDLEDNLAEKFPYFYKYGEPYDFRATLQGALDSIPEIRTDKSCNNANEILTKIANSIAIFVYSICDAYNEYYREIEQECEE